MKGRQEDPFFSRIDWSQNHSTKETGVYCTTCKKQLPEILNVYGSRYEILKKSGKKLGLNYFMSNSKYPGWVTAYCSDCWEPAILEHEAVQGKLADERQKLSQAIAKDLQEANFKFNRELTQLKSKNEQLEKENRTLSSKVETFSDGTRSHQAEISKLKNELSKLINELDGKTTELKEKEKDISTCKAQILQLEKKLTDQEMKILEREEENKNLTSKLKAERQESRLAEQKLEEEYKKASFKIEELEKLKINAETISDVPPSLSIQMDSLLELNHSDGWKINSSNYEAIKERMMIIVAVIGMYDVGKSWFCNEFTGRKVSTVGFNRRTDSINFHFPEADDGDLIGVIDTPGSNEAIRVTQTDLVQRIKVLNEKERYSEDEEYLLRYKLLKNDARILQDLKEKFIGEVADVLILICSKLSDKEQESIYKIIKYHKKILMDRNKECKGKAVRETKLYIVHNYKMLGEIDQVEEQVKRDLVESFEVKKVPLFNKKDPQFQNCYQEMYQDQFGISHLILAAHGTNAGKYYNPSTFSFLTQKVKVIENRTSANTEELFISFCNKYLHRVLQQEEIKLKLIDDKKSMKKSIVKEDGPEIVLQNLQYDEFGDFSLASGNFEPRYSILEKELENKRKEITVALEILDSEYNATLNKDAEGHFLCITGTKKVELKDAGKSMLCTNYNRESGKFNKKIRLSNWSKKAHKKIGPTNGILLFVFEFEKEEVIEL